MNEELTIGRWQVLCACGCGQEIVAKRWHKYTHPKYLPFHQLDKLHAENSDKAAAKRPPLRLCECGCGQVTTMVGKRPQRFISGHNARGVKGEASGGWKGGRTISSSGYVRVKMEGHHLADNHGYVLEHRLVWEQNNARELRRDEEVHHINGIRTDNRPENLVALTKSEHYQTHRTVANHYMTTEQLREAGRRGAAARWKKPYP